MTFVEKFSRDLTAQAHKIEGVEACRLSALFMPAYFRTRTEMLALREPPALVAVAVMVCEPRVGAPQPGLHDTSGPLN